MVYFTDNKTGKTYVYKILREDEVCKGMRKAYPNKTIIGYIGKMYNDNNELILGMYTWCIDSISYSFNVRAPTWVCPD